MTFETLEETDRHWKGAIILEYFYHEQLTNLDETGFGILCLDRPNPYAPAHWHQALELLLFVRGEAVCKFSHSVIHAGPGDICVINSHDIHETRCSADARYLVVHILPQRMNRYVPDFDILNFSTKFDPDDPVKSAALNAIREHMQRILELKIDEVHGCELEIYSRLFAMTDLLVKHFSKTTTAEKQRVSRSDMARLEPLLDYTQLHHPENLTLDMAADMLGLNREYFCRLFKKNMGVSYLTYLNQVRASAVCRELETSEDPLSFIAERHGFANSKMLNQYFRELYGCTPSEKRKYFRGMVSDGVY